MRLQDEAQLFKAQFNFRERGSDGATMAEPGLLGWGSAGQWTGLSKPGVRARKGVEFGGIR